MVALGKGEDYTTKCLLDCKYFRNYYQLICCNLYQQKSSMLVQGVFGNYNLTLC